MQVHTNFSSNVLVHNKLYQVYTLSLFSGVKLYATNVKVSVCLQFRIKNVLELKTTVKTHVFIFYKDNYVLVYRWRHCQKFAQSFE